MNSISYALATIFIQLSTYTIILCYYNLIVNDIVYIKKKNFNLQVYIISLSLNININIVIGRVLCLSKYLY